jgi:alcohol dehydrogenase
MKRSYRVAQVSKPSALGITERETPSPGLGEVLNAVKACGVRGADAADVDRASPSMRSARVPVSAGNLVVGERSILGSITDAVARMRPDQAKFRMVLTMMERSDAHQ